MFDGCAHPAGAGPGFLPNGLVVAWSVDVRDGDWRAPLSSRKRPPLRCRGLIPSRSTAWCRRPLATERMVKPGGWQYGRGGAKRARPTG